MKKLRMVVAGMTYRAYNRVFLSEIQKTSSLNISRKFFKPMNFGLERGS